MADTTASRLIVDVQGKGIESTSARMGKLDKVTVATAASVGLLSAAFVSVARSAIKGAAELEQNQIALTTMLKSADKANKLLSDIRKMGAETPFETKDLITAGKNLVAFGVASDQVVKKMTMLGDIAAGTSQPLKDIAILYGKMRIAGNVYAEDLNQLLERNINIFAELSKITGKSTVQIKKMASDGKLSFNLIEKAFENMTKKGGTFAGLMAAQSKSLAGLWSTFKSLIQDSATSLGTFFLPQLKGVLTYLVEIATKVYNWFKNQQNLNAVLEEAKVILKSIGIAAGLVAARFLAVFAVQKAMIAIGWIKYLWMMRVAILKNITLTNLWAGAQWLLNKALTANPIGIVIVLIAALSFAIYKLIKNWETVKYTFQSVMLSIKKGLIILEGETRVTVIKMANQLAQLLQGMGRPSAKLKEIVMEQTKALEGNAKALSKIRAEQRKLENIYNSRLKTVDKQGKKERESIKKTAAATTNLTNEAKKGKSAFEQLSETIQGFGSRAITAFSAIGSAVSAFQQAQIDALDARMQKELEAAGVAEQTTVQQAKKEYDAAVATGNALDIEEKRRALVKAQIEEKYQKQKQQLEYKAAETAWGFQLAAATAQGALAVLNAVAAGWKLGPVGAAVYGGLAAAAAGAQIAAIAAAKPQPPAAQMGGSFIVPPGNDGDTGILNVNSGEEVNVTPVSQTGQGNGGTIIVKIGEAEFRAFMIEEMNKIANSGDFLITRSNVVRTR